MASIQALLSIAAIIVSLLIGALFFYLVSNLPRQEKKKYIEEMISLLINFVIFVWIGKILIHFSLFIQDPVAVLAYPSNSLAFYIAFFFICVNIIYKVKRHAYAIKPVLNAFTPVFLMANFTYEFIQLTWHDSPYAWASMTLLVVLLILYLMLFDRVPDLIMYIIAFCWTIGQLLLAFFLPFTTMFNYIMEPWFLLIILALTLYFYLFYERRQVS